jgi:alkylation response protein AidB-like acyl-CoA dehydrogenase
LKYGSQEQIDYYVSRICAGATSFCQGFSEPNAGSDIASLKTRAVETDTGYVINGQKIWTSNASFADTCVLLARTGEGRSAITVFLVPMTTPGVEPRVIPGLQGSRSFHEVFFQDVEVPFSAVLGPPNEGWNVTRQILANERMGIPRYSLAWRGFNRAMERMRGDRRLNDSYVKARAAKCEAALRSARVLALRNVDKRVRGLDMGPNTSLARYAGSSSERAVCDFLADCCPDLLYFDVDPVIAGAYRRAQSGGIAAGAAEIQLNVVARDYLELPRGR